jgi:hypothetical protein
MRLDILDKGQSAFYKLKFWVMGKLGGMNPPDVVKMLAYRPEFFGKPFSSLADSSLRHSEVWSHGESELFAAFVSNRNQCPF